MTRLRNERETSLLEERAEEMDKMRAEMVEVRAELKEMGNRLHEAEMKLVSALAAYRLIANDLATRDPDSPILKQAQELLNVSYSTPRTLTRPADTLRPQPRRKGANT